jgi:hypothetical protein
MNEGSSVDLSVAGICHPDDWTLIYQSGTGALNCARLPAFEPRSGDGTHLTEPQGHALGSGAVRAGAVSAAHAGQRMAPAPATDPWAVWRRGGGKDR